MANKKEEEEVKLGNESPRFGALSSSADPTKLSLLIKGLLLALVPIVVSALEHYGVPLSEIDITEAINLVFGSIGACLALYGGLRRLYNKSKGKV